jgi:C1A family cysteine protease
MKRFGHIADPQHISVSDLATRNARELVGGASKTPTSASVREFFYQVEDQGESSACVGFAVGAVIEALAVSQSASLGRISKVALYTATRSIEKPFPAKLSDDGCMPSVMLAALISDGGAMVSEKSWPFDIKAVNRRLPLDVYQASDGLLIDYHRIGGAGETRVDLVRRAISKGLPVAFAMNVDSAYVDLPNHGVYTQCVKPTGSHMQVVTGYFKSVFEVRNSWGSEWSSKGYGHVHGDFLGSAQCTDFYVITAVPRKLVA